MGFAQGENEFNYAALKSTVEDALKRVFNPEFLNRIDDVIVFHPLEKMHINAIIDLMATELFDRAHDVGIDVVLEQSAKDFLVEKGYDAKYGARPLRRAIQKYVEDPMAEAILANNLSNGDTIVITFEGGEESEELTLETTKDGKTKTRTPKKPPTKNTKDDSSQKSPTTAEES
jgi:ATP-dependent Clp protease ATP-binding subunit ClpC